MVVVLRSWWCWGPCAIVFFTMDCDGPLLALRPHERRTCSPRCRRPSPAHPLGTDNLGRDVMTRMLHGTRISLTVGFVAVAVSITIGILIGSLAGYFGGIVDGILMRFVDMMMCFPDVLPDPDGGGAARAEHLEHHHRHRADELDRHGAVRAGGVPVAAAAGLRAGGRAGGLGSGRIIFRHILPNALAPVAVSAVLGIAGAILIEASLSFLGFGVQPPAPTWGNILADGKSVHPGRLVADRLPGPGDLRDDAEFLPGGRRDARGPGPEAEDWYISGSCCRCVPEDGCRVGPCPPATFGP